jgi:AcrR family transcriptional regulator
MLMTKTHKAEVRKKEILDALKRCLDKYAYSYISIQLVADEAGVSKGGLRYHFPTKESLFIELLKDFFTQIEEDHLRIVGSPDLDQDRVFLSTLFGIERFVLNEANIKIFLNLLLYALQDEIIRVPVQAFFRNHLNNYKKIITQAKSKLPAIDKSEFDLEFLARITQVIFLSTGLLEAVDPIGMNPSKLARYVISLFEE